MNDSMVEELTHRLPTAELVKIIKGALECGRLNRPFTHSELLRAMTFGASSTYLPPANAPSASIPSEGAKRRPSGIQPSRHREEETPLPLVRKRSA